MRTIMLISPKDNNFYNFRRELIERLNTLYRVILVCPYGSKIDYFTNIGCSFVDTYIDRRGTNPINDFKLILRYHKILKEHKPDLVLTYTTKCSVYAGIACRARGVKYIVNNAGLLETEKKQRFLKLILLFLYRVGFKGASCMMYQNSYERNTINNLLSKNIHYRDIPGSGVNTEEFCFEPYPREDSPIVFNYVARIVKIKGIDEFLKCAERIKFHHSEVKFVVYGDYDDDSYRHVIRDAVEKGIIEYRGVLLDMKPAIAVAHAVIHPSYYEGMTNVILEHSSMGRVCIASDIPGCREGVNDGETGYLFPCKNVDAMVEKVEQFLKLPYVQKKEMGIKAHEKMMREFDRNIVTAIYMEEINKLFHTYNE